MVRRRLHSTWPVTEHICWVPLCRHQQNYYTACLKSATSGMANFTSSLRHICQFAPPDHAALEPHMCTLHELLAGSAKLCHLHSHLASILPQRARVIIFCHSVVARNVVLAYLAAVANGAPGVQEGHAALFARKTPRVHGGVGSEASVAAISLFESGASPVLLLSAIAGGSGLNVPQAPTPNPNSPPAARSLQVGVASMYPRPPTFTSLTCRRPHVCMPSARHVPYVSPANRNSP